MLTAVRWEEERLEKIAAYHAEHMRADFINDEYIERLVAAPGVIDRTKIDGLIAKSRALKGLSPEETAYLLTIDDESVWKDIYSAAMDIKQKVYGNRIVLFAPLYLSSECVNNCTYCGFRSGNEQIARRCLSMDEIEREIRALTRGGHKRIIAVYGEHPSSDANYIVDSVWRMYQTKNGPDDIRRVNVNAAPMFVDEYAMIKSADIGTYQVFQETYHKATYRKLHPANTIKGDYYWRLFALHRAQEAGISDVAIGALIGLYDWRFEAVALVSHARDLEREFGVGSHTISFPRMEPAHNTPFVRQSGYAVSDDDMRKLIAVLRMAVPYTGLILTARENGELRRELIKLGVTQTDAGSNISIGGYGDHAAEIDKQQFELSDTRSLDDYISELIDDGYLPSFCTADYRCGRTGCEFMEYAKKGTIKNFCIPNAILTFQEYLLDYASPAVKNKGDELILSYVKDVKEQYSEGMANKTQAALASIRNGKRDLYF
ncbi:MAG: [FeFe] hydrogenase H-cluster radical SAM maturase HydG [Spirochaetes bacterium]|nr:[FeFe] hydrogenase H-cluster radical SAM maturase HydG [Spirochaetota bacterium]